MKGYIKIKVPMYQQKGMVPDMWTCTYYEKFPYIYLSEDFTHYLGKWLELKGVRCSIGGTMHRGFRTHYIIDRDKMITRVRDNRLARKLIKDDDIIKAKDGWLYLFNEEVRLG